MNWETTDILKQYMNDFGLCDAVCSHHPTLRDQCTTHILPEITF